MKIGHFWGQNGRFLIKKGYFWLVQAKKQVFDPIMTICEVIFSILSNFPDFKAREKFCADQMLPYTTKSVLNFVNVVVVFS